MNPKKSKLTKTDKRLKTLAAKTETQKKALLEQLEKYPVIQAACARAGIGRSTFYNWCKEDNEFTKLAKQNLEEGKEVINDLAVSKVIQGIQDGHPTFTIFWLKNNHAEYGDRVTHDHRYWASESEPLFAKEQWEALNTALHNIGYANVIKANSSGFSIDIDEVERSLPEAERTIEEYKKIHETEKEREDDRIRSKTLGRPENYKQIEKERHGVILKDFFKKWHQAKREAKKDGGKAVNLTEFFNKQREKQAQQDHS